MAGSESVGWRLVSTDDAAKRRSGSRLLEHDVQVVFEQLALLGLELSQRLGKRDLPLVKHIEIESRRDQKPSVAGKGEEDEPSVEQMVDVRRQQQAVGPINLLLVVRVFPRLDVTCP